MGYRDYPTKVPVDPTEKEKFMRKLGLDHLMRVWQWFEVYHLSPYVPPYFALQEESDGGDEGGGIQIIEIEKCFKVYDFGDYLATSAGDDYGPLSTARLLRTTDRMINLLAERGAKEIAFGKQCIEPAKLFAWTRALALGMSVFDYKPTEESVLRLEQTFGALGYRPEDIIQPD
jgi:hypothetical protein